MNQLQGFIQDSLLATGHVDQCAIVRRKDVSLRAASPGFTLSKSDLVKICEAHQNPIQTRDNGLQLFDTSYKCVRSDKYSIYAKSDDKGLVLVKTATLIILSTYTTTMYPAVCVEAAEMLADYFREKGK